VECQRTCAVAASLLQVEFRLAKPGLMRDFAGKWRVEPLTEQGTVAPQPALEPASRPQRAPWHSLSSAWQGWARSGQ
jgi:hypothetical protein